MDRVIIFPQQPLRLWFLDPTIAEAVTVVQNMKINSDNNYSIRISLCNLKRNLSIFIDIYDNIVLSFPVFHV